MSRQRHAPWFADGATTRNKYSPDDYPASNDWMDILQRDEVFVPLPEVVAHLVFAMAKDELGARISITRLESRFDGINDFSTPALIRDVGLRVDYINHVLGMAVVTDDSRSRVFQIRLDAVTEIEAATEPLALDPEKVPELTPVRL